MSKVKDLMANEDYMDYLLMRNLAEDLEDFDDEAVITYEVWAIGYDENGKVTDTEMLLGEFENPDSAVEYAKQVTLADIVHQAAEEYHGEELATNVFYISIEVETVIEDEEDSTMNIGTIYKRDLWLDGEYGSEEDFESTEDSIVELTAKDYELLEDGCLKISRAFLKDYNKNDYIRVHFADEAESGIFTYKIISKVIYADGDYYHCDMMI